MEILANKDGISFKGQDFDITWERLNTDGIQHWLNILIDKRWFTLEVEDQFLRTVGKHYGARG